LKGSGRVETLWSSESVKNIRRDREMSEKEKDLFQVPKIRMDNVLRSKDETQYSRVHRRRFKGQNLSTLTNFPEFGRTKKIRRRTDNNR
jgi:hypothetical protein